MDLPESLRSRLSEAELAELLTKSDLGAKKPVKSEPEDTGEGEVAMVQDGTDSCYDDEVEVIEEVGSSCCQPVMVIQQDDEWAGVESLLDDDKNPIDESAKDEAEVPIEELKCEVQIDNTTENVSPTQQPVEKENKLFLVRKVRPAPQAEGASAKMNPEEYQALVERMLAMQLREAEEIEDVDENGLQTIDLSDDIGATTAGTRPGDQPQPAAMPKPKSMMMDDDVPDFFRKTKSNNFFAMNDSLDKIEPLSNENNNDDDANAKDQNQAADVTRETAKDVNVVASLGVEDDIMKQVEKMMLEAEKLQRQQKPMELPDLDSL